VRNYARLLKLDPEPLIGRLAPRGESPPNASQIAERFRQDVPFSDSTKRSTLLYAGFSVGVLLLVAALAYEWQQQKAPPRLEAPALERTQPAEPAQTAAAAQPPVAAQPPEPPPAPVVLEKQPPPAPVIEKKKPAAPPVAAKAPSEKVAAAEDAENPLVPGTHRIVLRTEGEAWLEVKDGAGRMLISSLNPAGTERTLRGRAPFDIVIGNASSVKLTYDGKPVDLRPHTKVEVARFTLK
jgi:cytoskeleton protein RodZ